MWTVLGIAAISLAITWVLWAMFWPATRRESREAIPHWVASLMRFYDDSESLTIALTESSMPLFRIRCVRSGGGGCELVLQFLNCPLLERQRRDQLENELRRSGYDPIAENRDLEVETVMAVRVEIPDIWNVQAAAPVAHIAETALRVMGVERQERFDFRFHGRPSAARTREARERQKRGGRHWRWGA